MIPIFRNVLRYFHSFLLLLLFLMVIRVISLDRDRDVSIVNQDTFRRVH